MPWTPSGLTLNSAAENEERANVFRAALEQAEQQWTAARSVGYESRPLNLFYGLSQAGRAIAAVGLPQTYPAAFQPPAGAIQAWELGSHGIDVDDLNEVTPATFPEMVMVSKGKATSPGSFIRLASLLSRGCDVGAGVTMAQLWASVLEAVKSEPLSTETPSVAVLEGEKSVSLGLFRGVIYIKAGPQRRGEIHDVDADAFLEQDPTLVGYQLRKWEDGAPGEGFPAHWLYDLRHPTFKSAFGLLANVTCDPGKSIQDRPRRRVLFDRLPRAPGGAAEVQRERH